MKKLFERYENVFIAIAAAIALLSLHAVSVHAITVSAPQDPILTGDITTTEILDGTIVNADVNAAAAISVGSIGQMGSGTIPWSASGRMATDTATLFFDPYLKTLVVGSTTPSQTATSSGSIFASNEISAGRITATSTLRLRGVTYTPPSADGTNGQSIITDGAGNLSFSTIAATYSLTAGQTLIAGDPVLTAPVTAAAADFGDSGTAGDNNVCLSPNNEMMAQIIQEEAPKLIRGVDITLRKQASPTQDIVVEIVSLNAGGPMNGAVIASSSIANADITGSDQVFAVPFSPAVYLAGGQRHAIVVRCEPNTSGAVNYFRLREVSTGSYAGGTLMNWTGNAWNDNPVRDVLFTARDRGVTQGYAYLASAAGTTTASTTIGIVASNVSTSSPASIQGNGGTVTMPRSMTVGSTTYLGNDPRTATTTPGVWTKILGRMLTPVLMLVNIVY